MILYHINETMPLIRKESGFLRVCEELGIGAQKLSPADRFRTLGEILTDPAKSAASCAAQVKGTFAAKQTAKAGEPLPDVLIFNELEDSQLDRFLKRYKEAGLPPIPLKAVVTPINRMWKIDDLVRELTKEHEYMTGRRRS